MDKNSKIFVAGASGLVGSAIVRALKAQGYTNLLTPGSRVLNLTDAITVDRWFSNHKPEFVILAAAKVGGIHANSIYPADFLMENLKIQTSVIEASHKYEVEKLLFLGSSCIYPQLADQPIKEECLMTGHLEPTNDGYSIAKIAGIKMCESYRDQYSCNFISAMPCNIYGIGDNFHPTHSHLVPGIMQRLDAGDGLIWGTGKARRELLFADDAADACIFLLNEYNNREHINIGTGVDTSITDIASIIADVVGFDGEFTYDTSKPDGMLRRVIDVTKINNLGWKHKTSFEDGLLQMYNWWKSQ